MRMSASHAKDSQNWNWKGDEVGYHALHEWIRNKRGKPNYCECCKTSVIRRYDWANISKKYKRELSDWIRLCVPCHRKFDKKTPDFCACGKKHHSKGMCKQCYIRDWQKKNPKWLRKNKRKL